MAPSNVLTGDAFHDSTNTRPRASSTIPDGGTFSVYSSIDIQAPPTYVWNAIVNVSEYKEWNTFVPDVTITKQTSPQATTSTIELGSRMTFDVQMTKDTKTKSKEVVNHFETLPQAGVDSSGKITRIHWVLDNAGSMAPTFIIKAERTNEIEETAGGFTRYRTWEVFGGWSASVIRWMYGEALRERFQDWSRDLKKRAEELYARDQAQKRQS